LSTLVFLNLLASALLVALATPIVRLLFQYGKFDATATTEASFALMCLAPGLVSFSTVNILARAFYALGDTQTPMKISIFALVLNLVLAIVLVIPLQQGGLGIANTVTSICNVALLVVALRKKLSKLEMESVRTNTLWLIWLAILAGIIALMVWKCWEEKLGHATVALRIGAVFVPAIVAAIVYWVAAIALKIPAAREIFEFAAVRFKRKP
jgi:putative peptidoglycan lipid II flippase